MTAMEAAALGETLREILHHSLAGLRCDFGALTTDVALKLGNRRRVVPVHAVFQVAPQEEVKGDQVARAGGHATEARREITRLPNFVRKIWRVACAV